MKIVSKSAVRRASRLIRRWRTLEKHCRQVADKWKTKDNWRKAPWPEAREWCLGHAGALKKAAEELDAAIHSL